MIHIAMYHGFVPPRRPRALFLLRTAQHVRSMNAARELVRAVLALAGVASWGALFFLLAA